LFSAPSCRVPESHPSTAQDTEFAGPAIDLLFCSIKELEVPGQKHCFQLVGKDDISIILHAESEHELLEWIGSLRFPPLSALSSRLAPH